jgi:hypothetical protein
VSQNARKRLIAVGLLAVCSIVAIPATAQQSPVPQPLPVNVENTPSVNVANTPSVSVTNTPSVNVSNTPSVNVANTPTVALSSGASVNVTTPAGSLGFPQALTTLEAVFPVGYACEIDFEGNYYGTCNFPTVPQGANLVIQEFDAAGMVETGNRPELFWIDGTVTRGNWFTTTFMVNTEGYDYLATHQETRLYVFYGVAPSCNVLLPQNSYGTYNCNISGFLAYAPPGEQPMTTQPPKSILQLLKKRPAR